MKQTMRRAWICGCAVVLAWLSGACENEAESTSKGGGRGGGGSTTVATGPSGAGGQGGAGGAASCAAVQGEVVSLSTSDGVALQGDLYTTGMVGGPGAVLLHMIPPSNNRSNYPTAFIDKLVAAGITVLNIDRRGAGSSGGNAMEAYTGPNGVLDAVAARDFLVAHACAPESSRIAMVGASNGTTSALDYAVFAAGDPVRDVPKAMVFLTAGSYTENQNTLANNRAVLDPLAIMFVYSTAESGWTAPLQAGAPSNWMFSEYPGGAHGTSMFTAKPESMDDVATFLATAL